MINTALIINSLFLNKNLLREAVWSRKNPCSYHEIHMLFEHDFYLTKPIWPFVCENVARTYDVVANL